jgi:hypothetical protein
MKCFALLGLFSVACDMRSDEPARPTQPTIPGPRDPDAPRPSPDLPPIEPDPVDSGAAADTGPFPCGIDDLEVRLEARGADGAPVDRYGADERPALTAVVVNTCTEGPARFFSAVRCLVTRWNLVGPDDVETVLEPRCPAEETAWILQAGEAVEATWRLDAPPPPGEYDAEARFSVRDESAETSFEVSGLPIPPAP